MGTTRREFVAWLSALSLAGLARPLKADEGAEEAAAAAARDWLDLVDEGRYTCGWDAAAPAFKRMMTREEWDRAVHSVRAPLGRCVSRRLKSHQLVDSFPGGPSGPYVVLRFETDFENRRGAVETVTPARGKDESWRVAGYYIS
jgi:uncharacterized protein DUF4019